MKLLAYFLLMVSALSHAVEMEPLRYSNGEIAYRNSTYMGALTFSYDGRYVTYNGFVFDRAFGVEEKAFSNVIGSVDSSDIRNLFISGDGKHLLGYNSDYVLLSKNLNSGDERVVSLYNEVPFPININISSFDASYDGSKVSFSTSYSPLRVQGYFTNYIYDVKSSSMMAVPYADGAIEANQSSLSYDGQIIAQGVFCYVCGNPNSKISYGLTDGTPQVSLSNILTGSVYVKISGDGRYIYYSLNSYLYKFDTVTKNANKMVYAVNGRAFNIRDASVSSVSADGRYVVLESLKSFLAGDNNNVADVYLLDSISQEMILMQRDDVANTSDYQNSMAAISGDGRYIGFTSTDTTSVVQGVYGPIYSIRQPIIAKNPFIDNGDFCKAY